MSPASPVVGAFDVHVHSAPDVTARRSDDVQVVREYAAAGCAGIVLKAHYGCTAGRAQAAGAGTGIAVHGGLALNQQVGGINPAAVLAALEMGARIIWLPTADAHTQAAAGLPRLVDDHPELSTETYAIPPVDWDVRDRLRVILRAVAQADAVLATGHVSAAEVAWVLEEAASAGVRRVLMTHPSYTVPNMDDRDAAALATAHGAHAEVTAFQLLHQPGCDASRLARFVDTVGYDHVILSSDAGQTSSPSPPEALALLVDELAKAGLDREALLRCASDRPRRLVTDAP